MNWKRLRRYSPLVILLMMPLLGLGSWRWWHSATLPPQTKDTSNPQLVRLIVAPGTPASTLGEELHRKGLIRSPLAWRLWVRWQNWQDPQGGPQAGTYELSPNQTLSAIADQLWTGDVVQTRFTIPEGWAIRQMGNYFQQLGWFSAAEFQQATLKIPRDRFPWLPQGISSLEGYLYPDTYTLAAGTITPEQVIDLMLTQFATVALPLYQQHNQSRQPKLNLHQWVTLASIVEREAVIPRERPLIAGVFLNRLRTGMPLGADPTVEYALGIRQTPDQPLTLKQVRTPSPYNTYIHAGLPPGAIASPGRASLEAVLKPETTDYLYFVARYDGTHIFSRTLAEHELAQDRIHDQRETRSRS